MAASLEPGRACTSLRAAGVTLTYSTPRATTHAVLDVHLEIAPRSFAGIVGPSGSGKSSLLYLLGGLKAPTRGAVWFGDLNYSTAATAEQMAWRRGQCGYVFQQPFLVPYLNVLENVLLPLPGAGPEAARYAMELLAALEIAELAAKFPNECSGGERVRVAMARGLAHRPAYLFVDEPTASLDSATGARVMDVLLRQKQHGTLLVVTHDPEILDQAEVVFRMRDGRLMETLIPHQLTA